MSRGAQGHFRIEWAVGRRVTFARDRTLKCSSGDALLREKRTAGTLKVPAIA